MAQGIKWGVERERLRERERGQERERDIEIERNQREARLIYFLFDPSDGGHVVFPNAPISVDFPSQLVISYAQPYNVSFVDSVSQSFWMQTLTIDHDHYVA